MKRLSSVAATSLSLASYLPAGTGSNCSTNRQNIRDIYSQNYLVAFPEIFTQKRALFFSEHKVRLPVLLQAGAKMSQKTAKYFTR